MPSLATTLLSLTQLPSTLLATATATSPTEPTPMPHTTLLFALPTVLLRDKRPTLSTVSTVTSSPATHLSRMVSSRLRSVHCTRVLGTRATPSTRGTPRALMSTPSSMLTRTLTPLIWALGLALKAMPLSPLRHRLPRPRLRSRLLPLFPHLLPRGPSLLRP